MKHEIASMNTKKALSASLKKIINKKSFSKITVSELIQDCGVNRKTFYYHFTDIFDLLKWTLEQEAIDVVRQFDMIAEYEEVISFVMDYIDENNRFLNNIYNSVGQNELKHFFYSDFADIVHSIIDEAEKIEQLTVSEDYKEFLCEFYTDALAGLLVEWITEHSTKDREKTIHYISNTLKTTIPSALKNEACQ